MIGKDIRLERIFERNSGNALIVPMDHGISDGPIPGIVDIRETINSVALGGATAIVIHKGLVEHGHRGYGKDLGLIVHLSASTSLSPRPNKKVIVTGVEEAIRLGADAVSVHVNVGSDDDEMMMQDMGSIVAECRIWGMPLLAMMYARGKDIGDPYDVDLVKHVARVGAEIGADVVKVNYTGDEESFREVVKGCPAPILIAGGPKVDSDRAVLAMVAGSLKAGAKGASIGRNIWQHSEPQKITAAMSSILFQKKSEDEAMKMLVRS